MYSGGRVDDNIRFSVLLQLAVWRFYIFNTPTSLKRV